MREAEAAKVAEAENDWQTFTATAYTSDCYGCIGITKTGVDVSDTVTYKGRRVIAVDPSVIPLGSTVEIRLADGTTFEAVALDIGGGINGNEIDILKSTEARALDFGRQEVGVRIINEGER